MDNFNLKKYLIENKVTRNSRMVTEAMDTTYPISDEIANAFRMDVVKLKKEADSKYGFSKYEEGTDYKWAIGRGDDFPNALVIINSTMTQDPQVAKFIAWVEEDEDSMSETKKKHSKMMNEASEEEQHDLFWDLTEETGLEDILAELKLEGGITSEQLVRWIKDNWNSLDDEYEIGTALKVFKDAGITLDHVTGWIESHWYRIGDGTEES